MMRSIGISATLVAALGLACSASAGTWTEVGDAGHNGIAEAQLTDGSGPLDAIVGVIDGVYPDNCDIDLFGIEIVDSDAFYASLLIPDGGSHDFDDTVMWLFDADGYGAVRNDDWGHNDDYYASRIDAVGVPAPGVYYLGVAAYYSYAKDASNGLLFTGSGWFPGGHFQEMPDPDAGPLDHWTEHGYDEGGYTVVLNGAAFLVPEPGTAILLAMGGLMMLRRRR
ncbi:MAG: PEP-CTERM sorting domain-containing protein [Planctomycetota bacterium]